jgi:hypothetical protein
MPPDVPPLADQEAEGQFREEIGRIVDGVVEDIRSGHVGDRNTARSQSEAVAYQSRYAKEFASAVEAIRYGCGSDLKLQVRWLAAKIVWAAVRRELHGRPEYKALSKETNADGKEDRKQVDEARRQAGREEARRQAGGHAAEPGREGEEEADRPAGPQGRAPDDGEEAGGDAA